MSIDGKEGWLNWAVRRKIDGAYVGKIDAVIDLNDVATNFGYIFFPQFWGIFLTNYMSSLVTEFSGEMALKIALAHSGGRMMAFRVKDLKQPALFKQNFDQWFRSYEPQLANLGIDSKALQLKLQKVTSQEAFVTGIV